MHSGADMTDLDFVEKESGVKDMRDMDLESRKHADKMDEKEHDRLSNLDKTAFDSLTKTQGGV